MSVARTIVFALVFASLQLGWQALRGTSVEDAIVHYGTARPAALLVRTITPAVRVQAVSSSLLAPGGGINIVNGCEGSETVFLLVAAFAVAPLTWRSRLIGLLIGAAVAFVVNEARIVVLFYAYRSDPALFERLHTTVTPIAVVLIVAGYFYVWLFHATRRVAAAT